MFNLKIKRIYEASSTDDGYRILVDRLWPRGVAKERANIDKWTKEITPSTELRRTFNHTEDTMEEFKMRYNWELDNNEHAVEFINLVKEKLQEGNVTLLYAAKNKVYNHANVLRDWTEEKIR